MENMVKIRFDWSVNVKKAKFLKKVIREREHDKKTVSKSTYSPKMASAAKPIYEFTFESCRMCLSRIEQTRVLNCFITPLLKHTILTNAAKADQRRISSRTGRRSKLDGATIAIKDNFCMKNVKTTCASKMLENFTSPYDATVVKRLREAGAIFVGKTNMDEFAMGSGTTDSIFGATKNVWGSPVERLVRGEIEDSKENDNPFTEWRIAGGSSGGSAVAVATGCAFAAIGSDTGGSTRNPASYCGVVGFKPTYGAVSRYGLIPLVNSMDVPGILARKIKDAADVFDVIRGADISDSTTVNADIKPANVSEKIDLKNLTIGIPKEYHSEHITSEVIETWNHIANVFRNAGANVKEISMPYTQASIVTYTILNTCEVASNMARYSGLLYGHRSQSEISTDQLIAESRWEGFGPVVRTRILAGNYFLLQGNYEKYFVKAMKVRRLIADDFKNAWLSGINFILTPATLSTAPLLSEFTQLDNRSQCAIQDYCTQPVNMAGCPALSIPICVSKDGLPISLQIIGKNFEDNSLLSIANWLENVVSFPHLVQ